MMYQEVDSVQRELDKLVELRKEVEDRFSDKGFMIIDDVSSILTKKTKVVVSDSEGYLYKKSFEDIRGEHIPLPFHVRNPFTISNIGMYTRKFAPGFKFVSQQYNNATIKDLTWICPDGHNFTNSWNQFLQGRRCSHCTMPNKHLDKKAFSSILGDDYLIVSEYKNASTRVELQHKCGYKYFIQPCSFVDDGKRCAKCGKKKKKTHEEFTREVFEEVGEEYSVLGKYKKAKELLLMKHNLCNFEYDVTPTNFLSGKRCPLCSGAVSLNEDEFKDLVESLVGDEYTVLGSYVDTKANVLFRHNTCGNEWEVRPSHFTSANSRCPSCNNLSKAEKELGLYIDKVLINKNFSMTSQLWFEDLKGKSNYPYFFDFSIFNSLGELVLIIERHGKQHYEFIPYFHKDENDFVEQQYRDRMKELYCLRNNIPLEIINASKTNMKVEKEQILILLSDHKII